MSRSRGEMVRQTGIRGRNEARCDHPRYYNPITAGNRSPVAIRICVDWQTVNTHVDVCDMATLGIFAKWPQPGRVKTRLAAEIGAERAAHIYAAFLADILKKHRSFPGRRVIAYDPPNAQAARDFQELAGPGYELWPQPDGDLGTRLGTFFKSVLSADSAAVAVGADSPTMPAEFVMRAFEMLKSVDCIIGPGADGGYYLIGLRCERAHLWQNVDWGTHHVLTQTVGQLRQCGLTLDVLPIWHDVDTVEDLHALAGYAAACEHAAHSLAIPTTRKVLATWDADGPLG